MPPLTTVALPHYDMGYWGVMALLEIINSSDALAPRRKLQPCPLIRRASVGPPLETHQRRAYDRR